MKSPLTVGSPLVLFDELPSTQDVVARMLRDGEPVGVVMAKQQTAGRGRFGRPWFSRAGDSLTVSMAFTEYADHPRAYLVGMAVACAAAGVLHAQLRWPNDLVHQGKKVGGILTELLPDQSGKRVPVVGLGINLNHADFPDEIAEIATSLHIAHGGHYDAESVLKQILARLERMPDVQSWSDLSPIWQLFDATPGKFYRLPTGEYATALGVGSDGQLICSVDGESKVVMAAEALFGPNA